MFLYTNRPLTALNYFLTTLKLKKDFPEGYLSLGVTLGILGDNENAFNSLRFAHELSKNSK